MDVAKERQATRTETMEAGNMAETIAGAGAVVLSILALLDVLPMVLLSIAVIGAGVGMFFQGSAVAEEYSYLLSGQNYGNMNTLNIKSGLTMEALTGCVGVILGILSLIGLIPGLLTAISAIVLGCGLAMSSKSISRLNNLKIMHSGADDAAQQIARGAVSSASAAHVLIGIGAIALGILGVIGISPHLLTMVALLGVGAATLLSGLAVGSGLMAQ